MSSESEEDKEKLAQAAKMFFFQMQDIASFTNTLTELFNRHMNTQIVLTALKEDGSVKDFFEQILRVATEMSSVVDTVNKDMHDEPLHSKIATAMSSVVEQGINVKGLHQAAKKVSKNAYIPLIISVLSGGNILKILISSITLLMKSPIMNLQLRDLYRKDTKEQSNSSTSGKSMSSGPPETNATDSLKKLQDALKDENAKNPIESAASQLKEIVKTTRPVLETLEKATKALETNNPLFKKVSDK